MRLGQHCAPLSKSWSNAREKKMNELFDVVAVNINSSKVRLMADGKTKDNALALVWIAVARRGVNEEFFAEVPAGKYKEGDVWKGR